MTYRSRSAVVAVILATVLGAVSNVPHAGAEDSARVRAACTGDAQRLCPRQQLGSAEMRYCMEARAKSLSYGCVKALEDEGVIPRNTKRR